MKGTMTRYEFEQTVEKIKSTHRDHNLAIAALTNIRRLYLKGEGRVEGKRAMFKWAARKALV